MTYSHNSVSKNLRMTTAAVTNAATATKTIRKKHGVEAEDARKSGSGNTPPSTPPLSVHSNSIANNSTNYHQYNYQQHQQSILSISPSGNSMSSAISTSSDCSVSSVSSAGSNSIGSNSGYFATIRKQQRQQQQRRSPHQHQQQLNDNGSYFNNSPNYYQLQTQQQQPGSTSKRYGVSSGAASSQKYHDRQRSPQNQQTIRQSPASILGGGLSLSPTVSTSGANSSTRKARSKHTSPLMCVGGGKISPIHPLIPTALTHFAGSKCFDAPAPTALPKPPVHWTGSKSSEKVTSSAGPGLQSMLSSALARTSHNLHPHQNKHNYGGHVVKSSKRNLLDDFDTHNLKLLLNVQS